MKIDWSYVVWGLFLLMPLVCGLPLMVGFLLGQKTKEEVTEK